MVEYKVFVRENMERAKSEEGISIGYLRGVNSGCLNSSPKTY
jgi:hypothetical protein